MNATELLNYPGTWAWLAVVASHKVNGVAKIHSDLMTTSIFADFAELFPERFTNVTNGVTPRRWIAVANRPLAGFLDKHLGTPQWRLHLEKLAELNDLVDDPKVQAEFAEVKNANKRRLADYIERELGIKVNPEALFDVQIKRIHQYKRQAMNVMHIIDRYNRILAHPEKDWQPRVFIFAGKAASAYYMAKKIIRLINDVAAVINNDKRIHDLIKVVFIPNYSVSLAQIITPAADLSEQISLAGTEASGTGNMKFALGGALTIGTLDGANVEIAELVGDENIYTFGASSKQVEQLYADGTYDAGVLYRKPGIKLLVDFITNPAFMATGNAERLQRLHDDIKGKDWFMALLDIEEYIQTKERVLADYEDQDAWMRKALINIANAGTFSSDRTISQYNDEIWHLN